VNHLLTVEADMTRQRTEEDDDQDRRRRQEIRRRLGLSYKRFSDPRQSRGDSEDRQDRDFRNFCQRHNLTPLSADYTDRGLSGYHGKHRKKGRLGELIAAARDGRFEPGTIIVIEAWDRLGRMIPNKQIKLIEELLETGVNIGICRLDDVFTMEDFGTHKWTTLAVFVQLAYQESKQKSERVGAAWAKRRERARGKGEFMRGSLPAWLRIVNGVIVPIPEAVAAVGRIFELSGSGFGVARIIRTLIKEDFAPFGPTGRWSHSYINILLNDRRVLGEFQPMKGGKPDGQVIPDYYPRVIEDDAFQLARAGQDGRRRSGNRDRRHVNVFQGLLKSALDGEGFTMFNRATEKNPALMLAPLSGRFGRGPFQSFPYLVFEKAILWEALPGLDPALVLPKPQTEKPNVVEVLRARLKNIRSDLAGLQASLKESYSKTLDAILRDKEKEEERIAGELQDELAKSVQTVEKAWEQMPRLAQLIEAEGDEARLRIRSALRTIVSDARLLLIRRQPQLFALTQFFFTGGGSRSWLVCYRQASRNRPGGWCWCSLDEALGADDLDLRRRDHAARAEAGLLKLDPQWLAAKMRDRA
jgi:DNA invertase Pin-like site-specific DNA recombinase